MSSQWRTTVEHWLLLAAVFLVAAEPAAATTLVRAFELPGLVHESQRSVLGTVTEVRYGLDEHRLPSTWVTLQVEDAIYGSSLPEPGAALTIKLLGTPRPLPDGSALSVAGTPRYTVGERYLLLLIGDSRWGFTSAAGLFQGAFRIDDAGRVAGVRADAAVFGKDGLAARVDLSELTGTERSALAMDGAPVPYTVLRRAIVTLHQRRGGLLRAPVDDTVSDPSPEDTTATYGPHFAPAPGAGR